MAGGKGEAEAGEIGGRQLSFRAGIIRLGAAVALLAIDRQVDGQRVTLVGHSVGTAGFGTDPHFETFAAELADPGGAPATKRGVARPDADARLVFGGGVGDAAALDPRAPEGLRADRANRSAWRRSEPCIRQGPAAADWAMLAEPSTVGSGWVSAG